MNNKNNIFLEEYKRLDVLCKDIFKSKDGISEYIRQMEETSYIDRKFYADWETDYRQLKHLRWIRNQLTHEIGTLEEDFCTDLDINWIRTFHQRILNLSDPLSIVRIQKDKFIKNNAQPQTNTPKQEKTEESVWKKIIEKIRKIFTK